MSIITRIAPSPTGYLHFGLARTALFSYLHARKNGGQFYLRIEDTDIARNKPEYEADIDEQLAWLGLQADKRFKQSDHRSRHSECLAQLIEGGHAYVSEEPAKDDPSKTVSVVRLKNPGETVEFDDLIRGHIRFDTTELGDFVIARSVDDPLYHMAVVVDDADEGVTDIIRGEDHISNTPRHILLQRALGFQTPRYAHIPLILMPDKSKMSKRKEGSSVKAYREQGILPEALVNFLALLGWNPGTEQELFIMDELVQSFDITKVHKSGAIFDAEKLLWFNHEYLRALSDEAYGQRLSDFGISAPPQTFSLLKERARTLSEAGDLLKAGEFSFMDDTISYEPTLLTKGAKVDTETAKKHLAAVLTLLEQMAENDFTAEQVKEIVFPYATEAGRGAVLWPLRVSLSGREKSPDPFVIMSLIGKEKTLSRVKDAIDSL